MYGATNILEFAQFLSMSYLYYLGNFPCYLDNFNTILLLMESLLLKAMTLLCGTEIATF